MHEGVFAMTKRYIEVSNCHEIGSRYDMGFALEIVKGVDVGNSMIKLENGLFLKDMGDGRFYCSDSNDRWALVLLNEYDGNDLIQGDELGYTNID